jgi:hypothetical protein
MSRAGRIRRTLPCVPHLPRTGALSFAEVGSVQNFVHMGTNTVPLVAGLDFDQMTLDYALIASYENDQNNPQPSGPPTASTISGPLPIFGAPELDPFHPGAISYLAPSAVPEPSTYALVLGGLGLLGTMARRRKASTQA